MAIEIRMLESGDDAVFEHVAPGVFDNECDPLLIAEFLADARHHLAVAIDGAQLVGFASGVHYIHPDKAGTCGSMRSPSRQAIRVAALAKRF